MNEDPRKIGLKEGLRQLSASQIQKVLDWPHEMVLDTWNYCDGKYCPLAVAVGIPETMDNPSHESVYNELVKLGYKIYNTRGIKGDFYTKNRNKDLIDAAKEVLEEKL